jgi:hypothetical protein
VQFRQRTAKPYIGLVDISERFLGDGLDTQQSNGAIGFLNRKGLLFFGAMTACALGYHELLNFLVAKACLRQAAKRRQRKPLSNRQSEFGLRAHNAAEDQAAAKLFHYYFNDGHWRLAVRQHAV